jgi:hypothetical protein
MNDLNLIMQFQSAFFRQNHTLGLEKGDNNDKGKSNQKEEKSN